MKCFNPILKNSKPLNWDCFFSIYPSVNGLVIKQQQKPSRVAQRGSYLTESCSSLGTRSHFLLMVFLWIHLVVLGWAGTGLTGHRKLNVDVEELLSITKDMSRRVGPSSSLSIKQSAYVVWQSALSQSAHNFRGEKSKRHVYCNHNIKTLLQP